MKIIIETSVTMVMDNLTDLTIMQLNFNCHNKSHLLEDGVSLICHVTMAMDNYKG